MLEESLQLAFLFIVYLAFGTFSFFFGAMPACQVSTASVLVSALYQFAQIATQTQCNIHKFYRARLYLKDCASILNAARGLTVGEEDAETKGDDGAATIINRDVSVSVDANAKKNGRSGAAEEDTSATPLKTDDVETQV